MYQAKSKYGRAEARLKDGRLCLTGKPVRTRAKVGWKYYNVIYITWVDEEGHDLGGETMPLGRFNSMKPAATGHYRVWDAMLKRFV